MARKKQSHQHKELMFPGLNISKAKFAFMFRKLNEDGHIRSGGCTIEEHCLNCKSDNINTKYCENEDILWCCFWQNKDIKKDDTEVNT